MSSPALLPVSSRRLAALSPSSPASFYPHHRATLRLSEKFILLLILSAFITLCFGAIFFLPDSSKHRRFDLGLQDVLIPHVEQGRPAGRDGSAGLQGGGVMVHGGGEEHQHRHRDEEEQLRKMIRADHERALEEAKEKLKKSKDQIRAEIQTEKNRVKQDMKKREGKQLPHVPIPKLVGINNGDPGDPDTREKQEKIKELFRDVTAQLRGKWDLNAGLLALRKGYHHFTTRAPKCIEHCMSGVICGSVRSAVTFMLECCGFPPAPET